jgi:adenylate cyclase class 2
MHTEIEAKFLNIDIDTIRTKLNSLGANLIHQERLMTRRNFDYPDLRLQKKSGWVRVRNEGDKVTLAYKQLNDRTLTGTKEVSVMVSSFIDTCEFLESIGLETKTIQETKRESWVLGDIEIEIDTWPWVPTFLEIEAKSEKEVREMAKSLDLDWEKAVHGSVEIVYQGYFDVSEDEVDSWQISFSKIPKWLEEKRIK